MDRNWQWGAADCCTAACDVFAALYEIDPMADLRGRYDSLRTAAKIIDDEYGGFLEMAEIQADQYGLSHATGDTTGAIGCVSNPFFGYSMATGLGNGLWAVKTLRGFGVTKQIVKAWHV